VTAKRPSLTDYAKTVTRPGVKCWMCGIPERAEVEQAVSTGAVSKAAATRWLRDVCGYPEATPSRVENHLANHADRAA
jgi:hypothetical protein